MSQKITLKDIDKMDMLFKQSIHLAQEGLKQCAEWRRELEDGTPKAPKNIPDEVKYAAIIADAKAKRERRVKKAMEKR